MSPVNARDGGRTARSACQCKQANCVIVLPHASLKDSLGVSLQTSVAEHARDAPDMLPTGVSQHDESGLVHCTCKLGDTAWQSQNTVRAQAQTMDTSSSCHTRSTLLGTAGCAGAAAAAAAAAAGGGGSC